MFLSIFIGHKTAGLQNVGGSDKSLINRYQNVQSGIGKCVYDKRKCTTMVNTLTSGDIEIGCSIDI